NAVDGRRVAVVKARVYRVGGERGGVVVVKLHEGRHECGCGGLLCGVAVGLELVAAGDPGSQGRDPEREDRYNQKEQDQGKRVVGAPKLGNDAQPVVEPDLLRQPAQGQEEDQREHERQPHAPDDVAVLEVPQLMGKHRFDLVGVQSRQQGVEVDYAVRIAAIGDVGF